MLRRWSTWASVAAVLYVGFAALRLDPGARSAWAGLLLGPLVLLVGWSVAGPPRDAYDPVHALARGAARLTVSGSALVLVASVSPAAASFDAARTLGVGVAAVASLVALAHVTSLADLTRADVRWRDLDGAAFTALSWAVAVGLAVARLLAPERLPWLDPLAIHYAAVAAALGSLGITLVTSFRLYVQRRFELGVSERAAAALWLSVLCVFVGVFGALMSIAAPERIIPLTALAAAVCVTAAAVSSRPSLLARLMRLSAAVTMLCAPVVCVAVVVAFKAPTHAGLILFVVTIVAALLGLLSPHLARRLAPERGRWLTTIDEALTAVTREPDPTRAMVAVLASIREGLPRDAEPPALYRVAPRDCVTVDRAGYLHAEEAELPPRLVELGQEQPERVVSTEALRHVQVRRTEVRPLVDWLDARGAAAAALILDEEVCVGLLVWPAASRVSPLELEEVRGLRTLADHIGSALGAAAQLARSRAREHRAEQEVIAARAEVEALREVVGRQAARRRAEAEAVARAATIAAYSPAAQAALVAAERLGQSGAAFGVVAPPGVDVACWAAVAHLASPRAGGPLLVLDATVEAQEVARYRDEARSPLILAAGGTLVITDAQLLPQDTQRYIATSLGDDTGLVVTVSAPSADPSALLDPHLQGRVAERWLRIPALAERAEDLRALALYRLSRIGLRMRGAPYGLSLRAQALLNEHDWPGNDAELDATLLRAALDTDGDVVDDRRLARWLGAPAPPLGRAAG